MNLTIRTIYKFNGKISIKWYKYSGNKSYGSHNREIVNCYEFSLKTFHNKKLRVNLSVIKGEGMTNDAWYIYQSPTKGMWSLWLWGPLLLEGFEWVEV